MAKVLLSTLVPVSLFLEQHMQNKIPVKTAFKWNKMGRAIAEDVQFFRTRYTELFQKYGKEENGTYTILPENVDKYNEEMKELLEVEVEAPEIKFTLDEFEGLEITPEELLPLMNFIEE